ncbi:MAG: hypothetical protein OQL16_12735 [Gammaproteobacteria bacterium]|nr:hypothetical protein [Gammaproteobacteria bacterium]
MKQTELELRPWESLTTDEQLKLQVEYGHYLDSLPPSCSMETEIERFRSWQAERESATRASV